jgi:hypothetical protein
MVNPPALEPTIPMARMPMVLDVTVAAAAAASDDIVHQARTETTVVARIRSIAVARVKSPPQP